MDPCYTAKRSTLFCHPRTAACRLAIWTTPILAAQNTKTLALDVTGIIRAGAEPASKCEFTACKYLHCEMNRCPIVV